MKEIRVEDVRPGMILAERLISPRGQVLAEAGMPVTAQQMLHASYYGIEKLKVKDEDDAIEQYDFDAPDDFIGETQSWRIVNSEEFHEFKEAYHSSVARLEAIVEDFLKNKAPIHSDELLDDIQNSFVKHSTGLGIMSMMLNIQEIDASTYEHSVNVAIIARVLGGWLGITDKTELDVLTMCGLFHDIGKSLIPNVILTKPDRLTTEEYARMAEHPVLGYNILMDQEIDRRIKMAALQHHERCDGTGYPYGLTKDFIGYYSKIIAIADVYDAMTADRVYRAGICPFEVIAQFQRQPNGKYDTDILMTFLKNIAESYIGTGVLLSDRSRGIIKHIKQDALSSPLIQLDDGTFVDLLDRTDLYIKACI